MRKDELQELIGSPEAVEFRAKTQSECYEMAMTLCYLDAIDFSDYEKNLPELDFNELIDRRLSLLAVLLMANVERTESIKRIVEPDFIEPRLRVLKAAVEHMAAHFRVLPSESRSRQSIGLTKAIDVLASNIYRHESFMEESRSYLSSLSGVNDTISGGRDPLRKKNLSIYFNFESWRDRNPQHLDDLSGNHKSMQVEKEVSQLEESLGDMRGNLHNEDLLRAHLPKHVQEAAAESRAKTEAQVARSTQISKSDSEAPQQGLFQPSSPKEDRSSEQKNDKKLAPVSSASQLADIDELLDDEQSSSPELKL